MLTIVDDGAQHDVPSPQQRIDQMKRPIICLVVLALAFSPALAKNKSGSKRSSSTTSGPVVFNGSNSTYVNNGNINGGSSTGLTVNGQNNRVVNNGNITGSTGVRVNGSLSGVVNTGRITGGVRIGGP